MIPFMSKYRLSNSIPKFNIRERERGVNREEGKEEEEEEVVVVVVVVREVVVVVVREKREVREVR